MPNIKSAKKRVLVAKKKTMRNQMAKSLVRTAIRRFEEAVLAGDKALAQETYKNAVKKIDQAVAHGILHKNNAARKKSRFTLMLNSMH